MKTSTSLIVALLAALAPVACTTSTAAPGKAKPYPLRTCIVTDNALESMGGSISRVHQGQQVKFCCKPCVRKFDAAPAKYLAKLKQ